MRVSNVLPQTRFTPTLSGINLLGSVFFRHGGLEISKYRHTRFLVFVFRSTNKASDSGCFSPEVYC